MIEKVRFKNILWLSIFGILVSIGTLLTMAFYSAFSALATTRAFESIPHTFSTLMPVWLVASLLGFTPLAITALSVPAPIRRYIFLHISSSVLSGLVFFFLHPTGSALLGFVLWSVFTLGALGILLLEFRRQARYRPRYGL